MAFASTVRWRSSEYAVASTSRRTFNGRRALSGGLEPDIRRFFEQMMEHNDYFCFYCGSRDVRVAYAGKFHQRKKDHGPFNFYRCADCGSGLTLPAPQPAVLADLYRSFEFGLSKFTRGLLSENPAAVWHETCAKRIIKLSGLAPEEVFTWVDVGAGGGEIARKFAAHFPRSTGLAIDIHDRPPELVDGPANIEWQRIDIARDSFAAELARKADVVFAVGVWEHVRRPDIFADNVLSLLNPGGLLYMETPNYGSLARRLMGARWPYFLPGEHLCMPTPKGARLCLSRALMRLDHKTSALTVTAHPILIRYSLGFVFAKFAMPGIARIVPSNLYAHLPSGAMESVVRLDAAS
jgi:2-polyprenyl-3-methyl-5-hydroxy-6-metoxy-1,4-benzoquinol methylase/DNA-directed RNA polymerase subunit RPC12/RpoP